MTVEELKEEKEKAIDQIKEGSKKAVETFLQISIDNTSKTGMFGINKSIDEFKKDRAEYIELLRQQGTEDSKILNIIEPLNVQISKEYSLQIDAKIEKQIKEIEKQGLINHEESVNLENTINQKFKYDQYEAIKNQEIEEIVKILKDKNIYTDEIEAGFSSLKEFLLKSQDLNYE